MDALRVMGYGHLPLTFVLFCQAYVQTLAVLRPHAFFCLKYEANAL